MINIAVLVSGGGTNLQALIDAQSRGDIKNGKIKLVISSNSKAYALKRAEQNKIPSLVISRKDFVNSEEFDKKILLTLKENNIGLIVLAGYLSILSADITSSFHNKIINVHPSLIPSFCGNGFYGLRVHEAVLARGVKITGATVHFVNEIADNGPIILQKTVKIKKNDTPESLQRRVMEEAEWKLLPKAVSLFCEGKIQMKNGKAIISD